MTGPDRCTAAPSRRRLPANPHGGAAHGWLDLWTLPVPHGSPSYPLVTTELDEQELARAEGFRLPRDRLLYLSAHIALRRTLAAYLNVGPGEIRFVREPCPRCGAAHGRPAVDHPAAAPHFSLSHSSGLVLFGVATSPVGVDVQRLPADGTVDLCSSALHPAEQAELAHASPTERRLLFGRLWTRKEAYLKGLGTGLRRTLAADYLGDNPDGAARPQGWTVADVPCGPGHVAAAAVLGDVTWPRAVHRVPDECLYAPEPAGVVTPPSRHHVPDRIPTGECH